MGVATYGCGYVWVWLRMGVTRYGCGYVWVWLRMGVATYGCGYKGTVAVIKTVMQFSTMTTNSNHNRCYLIRQARQATRAHAWS